MTIDTEALTLIAGKIDGMENRLSARLTDIQRTCTDTANGVLTLSARMAQVEARQETIEARLTLLESRTPEPSDPGSEVPHAAQ